MTAGQPAERISLGVVVARGASKRLPRKNVRPLAGLPLVAWTCRAAMASKIDRVILSTEDAEIAEIGRAAGIEVPFTRPVALAEDYARDTDILLHAVDSAEEIYNERYRTVVLIQATTPFVRPEHFDACLDRQLSGGFNCVFLARKVEDHPRWMWTADDAGQAEPFMTGSLSADEQHSQNLRPVYYPNGAAWAIDLKTLRAREEVYCAPLGLVEAPAEFSVDIDDARDLAVAEAVAAECKIEPVAVRGEVK
ncbi:cytidylyltransferase domain-containing protein [Hwanghaeella sp.]|uniref:acylneuraminate cytidylyltransferase family protein n=1 Tax=Hwanghaeella sp. TaxID=2605943 RepID=UPI003CCBBFBE